MPGGFVVVCCIWKYLLDWMVRLFCGRRIWLPCLVLLLLVAHVGWPVLAASLEEHVTVWYLPHPDDEALGMAGAIQASKGASHRNVFVFLTKGAGTLARLAGRDGAERALSTQELKEARIREAREAIRALDEAPGEVVFYDYPDGRLSVSEALGVMRDFHRRYPGASHRTVSGWDPHADHKAAAAALTLLSAETNGELDVRFYRVYIYRQPLERRLLERVVREAIPDPEAKRSALAAYNVFDPEQGRYAIGSRSVPGLIKAAASDCYEYSDLVGAPLRGFERTYLLVGNSLSVETSYAFIVSGWRLSVRGESGPSPGVAMGLQYRLIGLPAFSGIYASGGWRMGGTTGERFFLAIRALILNLLFAEYHPLPGSKAGGTRWYWGVRLPLR